MFLDTVSNLTVTNILSANRLLHSPIGVTTHRKSRERWAVALKLEGKTVYTVAGHPVLSDSRHPVLLPKGCDYSWRCELPGECILIEFDADETADDFTCFETADASTVTNAFLKIEKHLNLQAPYSKAKCFQALYEVLSFLMKSTESEYVPSQRARLLAPAVTYIAQNYYDGSISNDSLANLCGISTVHFRKTFEKIYGVSPIKYLHNFRLQKAKTLLHSDYDTIEQVALSVGYNSIYHFSKMFKQYTGITPTEYASRARS